LLYNKFKTENENRNLTFAKKNTVKDFGFSFNTDINLNPFLNLKSGYQYSAKDVSYLFVSQDNNNNTFEDSNTSNLYTHALYSSLELDKPKNFYLNSGLRVNYYHNLKRLFIEPRFNFGKYLTNNTRLNLSAEHKTQALSKIDETIESGLSLENKLWSVADNTNFSCNYSHPIYIWIVVCQK